jgi:AcrR family transcriptional regulator
VGIGTLHRRFPARELLVDATYRYETARLAGSAADLVSDLPADQALRAWMSGVLDYLTSRSENPGEADRGRRWHLTSPP